MRKDSLKIKKNIIFVYNLKTSYVKILKEKEKNKDFNSNIIFFIKIEEIFQNLDIFPIIKKLELNGFSLFATQSKDFKVDFTNELCLIEYKNQQIYTMFEFTELFISFIFSQTVGKLINSSKNFNQEINAANIPQFSNFDNGSTHLTKILADCGDFGPDFIALGRYLTVKGKNDIAYRKYGENHSKLANLLGLCYLDFTKRPSKIYLTSLGLELSKKNIEKQKELIAKLSIQIPVISISLIEAQKEKINLREKILYFLSKTTTDRRIPNVVYILDNIRKYTKEISIFEIFNNIER